MRTRKTIANKLFGVFNPVKLFLIRLGGMLTIVIAALSIGMY